MTRTYETMVLLDNRDVKKGWDTLKGEVAGLFEMALKLSDPVVEASHIGHHGHHFVLDKPGRLFHAHILHYRPHGVEGGP